MYFDTHAHYDSSKFSDDRDEVLRAVYEDGISLIVDPGDTLERSRAVVSLADQYDYLYAAVGVHPEEYETWTDDTIDQLRLLAKAPKVVAIGNWIIIGIRRTQICRSRCFARRLTLRWS